MQNISNFSDPGMASVILPIASFWLALGGTIDLLTYDTGSRYSTRSVFDESDFVEKPVDILNSTYYVVQEENLPYSAMGLPIDLVRRVKSDNFNPSSTTAGIPRLLKNLITDRVVLLTVTEYRTVERSIKKNAVPKPGWQESAPKTQTHYADRMYYGGRCIGMAEFVSEIPGDNQVVRKLITDVMGTSGAVTEDTVASWRRAMRTVKDSPDVRGFVSLKAFTAECQNIMLPSAAQMGLESFLEVLPNVKNFTGPYNRERRTAPIDVSFEPLRSLDDEYPALEKNKVSEQYLLLLDEKVDDLDSTYKKMRNSPYIPRENLHLFTNFHKMVRKLRDEIRKLTYGEMSIYRDLDVEQFEDAFKKYKAGLDKGDRNYYAAYKKLIEDIGMDCGRSFQNSTSGVLVTSEDEVLNKGSVAGGLEECEEHCLTNARCRAIGYGGSASNQCHIYYRSTSTAAIVSPTEVSFMKVYDRKCEEKE